MQELVPIILHDVPLLFLEGFEVSAIRQMAHIISRSNVNVRHIRRRDNAYDSVMILPPISGWGPPTMTDTNHPVCFAIESAITWIVRGNFFTALMADLTTYKTTGNTFERTWHILHFSRRCHQALLAILLSGAI